MNIFGKMGGIALSVVLVSGAVGCKKSYLDRSPSDAVAIDSVFRTTATAKEAVQGLHRYMYQVGDPETFGQKSIDLMSDLMGEDMPISGTGAGWYTSVYNYNDARVSGGTPGYTWGYYYRIINNANMILANIDKAEGPQNERDNIKGQAMFYRAFAYYNLCLYYQQTYAGTGPFNGQTMDFKNAPGVPLYTAPTTVGTPRAPMSEVFAQITSDLRNAIELLDGNTAGGGKTEINQNIAKGLYARVALSMNDWPTAAQMANEARQGYPYMSAAECQAGFNSANNPEWMWASTTNNEQLGNAYNSFISHMIYGSGGYANLGCQKVFYRPLAESIKPTDVRINWYYKKDEAPGFVPYSQKKFKQKTPGNWSTDLLWMRAGEMALIEAEARAFAGQVGQAKQVLDEFIQTRDASYSAPSVKDDLIKEIVLQRRIELWGEGFRFIDIKRQMAFPQLADNVKGLHRRTTSNDVSPNGLHVSLYVGSRSKDIGIYASDFLFKIPSSELSNNKGVVQNQ
ncbi:RagB/SusD family nutrient uptake outer membrane protein [Taibaiella helva]|uniref:RagB/SusD family nutrient uptake outer membrane protein n=1 Tax=Taibaiella helva TaxID=2301235 RepID=UPI000E5826C1|nr:RagB/SusD family nutrient uptake outer membrane protein [Taibaiella helva]